MLDMQTSQNLIHKETTHVNKIVIALMIAVVAAGPAVASEETEVMVLFVPIRFPSSMNFHPYAWHGAGACAKWSSDYDADAKKKGITEGHVTLASRLKSMSLGTASTSSAPPITPTKKR